MVLKVLSHSLSYSLSLSLSLSFSFSRSLSLTNTPFIFFYLSLFFQLFLPLLGALFLPLFQYILQRLIDFCEFISFSSHSTSASLYVHLTLSLPFSQYPDLFLAFSPFLHLCFFLSFFDSLSLLGLVVCVCVCLFLSPNFLTLTLALFKEPEESVGRRWIGVKVVISFS